MFLGTVVFFLAARREAECDPTARPRKPTYWVGPAFPAGSTNAGRDPDPAVPGPVAGARALRPGALRRSVFRASLTGFRACGGLATGLDECNLKLGKGITDRRGLTGSDGFDRGKETPDRVDRDPRLFEVPLPFGPGGRPEPAPGELHESDDRLEDHISDVDTPHLLFEGGPELLLCRRPVTAGFDRLLLVAHAATPGA